MLKKMILLVALVALVASTQVFAADESGAAAKPAPAPARERTVPAAPGGGGMGGGMGRGMGMGVWGVLPQITPALTEDQKTKVTELRTAAMEKMQTAGAAVMAAQTKVMEVVNAGGSEADVRTAAADYAKAWTEQQVQNAASVKQVRDILTAEQKTDLDKLMKERAAQFRGGQGGGRGQGGGGRGGAGGADGGAAPRAPRPAAPAGGAQN
jgi:Spy/CpxP family protein refolding chaperone